MCPVRAGSGNGSFYLRRSRSAWGRERGRSWFSNCTGLAPSSTMIAAICRSLSQRGKTEQKITPGRKQTQLSDRKRLKWGNRSFTCKPDLSLFLQNRVRGAFCCFNNNQLLPSETADPVKDSPRSLLSRNSAARRSTWMLQKPPSIAVDLCIWYKITVGKQAAAAAVQTSAWSRRSSVWGQWTAPCTGDAFKDTPENSVIFTSESLTESQVRLRAVSSLFVVFISFSFCFFYF